MGESSIIKRLAAAGVMVALIAAPQSAVAQISASHPTMSMSELTNVLNNMGYEVKADGPSRLTINASGYVIAFAGSSDQTQLYISITYGVTADQAPHVPKDQMLIYNGINTDYFYIHQTNGATDWEGLMLRVPSAVATPLTLRSTLDSLTGDANSEQNVINPANWH